MALLHDPVPLQRGQPRPGGSSFADLRLELPGRRLRVAATVVRSEPFRRAGPWKIATRVDQMSRSDSKGCRVPAAKMGSRLE
jgi:hypothetical protein